MSARQNIVSESVEPSHHVEEGAGRRRGRGRAGISMEAVDRAVVDEQPVLVPERMAVGLLNGRPGGRAHVREEQRRADVGREAAEVAVAPRGHQAAVDAGRLAASVYQPTPKPSPLNVSTPSRACRLCSISECFGLVEQRLDRQRLAAVGHPAAHQADTSLGLLGRPQLGHPSTARPAGLLEHGLDHGRERHGQDRADDAEQRAGDQHGDDRGEARQVRPPAGTRSGRRRSSRAAGRSAG